MMRSQLTLLLITLAILVSCSRKDGDAMREPDKVTAPAAKAGETRTIVGVLEYYPQDVKSVQAWLGHEYMVGEIQIRATQSVPAETLKKMAGRMVKIEGVWHSGEKSHRTQPTEDEIYMQAPLLPEGEVVTEGPGIDALSVVEVDK